MKDVASCSYGQPLGRRYQPKISEWGNPIDLIVCDLIYFKGRLCELKHLSNGGKKSNEIPVVVASNQEQPKPSIYRGVVRPQYPTARI